MSGKDGGDSHKPLQAFVSFPSHYTQTLLMKALVSTLPAISISLIPPSDEDPPALQWADYDLISWDIPHASPSTHLTSSYIYRKALIRKHQLHRTIIEYLAKCQHRGNKSILAEGGIPQGWIVELQFADELDEALMDDLYELGEVLRRNEELDEADRSWFILKPGFADRAQGIRLFSTEDQLRSIFESFETPSDDEEDEENDEEDQNGERRGPNDLMNKLQISDEDEDEGGTGVMTSQLRHFVIQEYIPRPILFDINQIPGEPSTDLTGYKFHIRAYVLISGAYTVYLSQTMLALFSASPYTHPTATNLDPENIEESLRPHLTNTCLQTDGFGAPMPSEELVKQFWELEGLYALILDKDGGYSSRGKVDRGWLDKTYARIGEVVSESVKAGAECGSFGLQFVPNAFEIFGVDLMCSFPETTSAVAEDLPIPRVTLLEYNASPDFHQSGERLKSELQQMFSGVVRLCVAPFFGLKTVDETRDEEEGRTVGSDHVEQALGETRYGWTMIGKAEVRSFE